MAETARRCRSEFEGLRCSRRSAHGGRHEFRYGPEKPLLYWTDEDMPDENAEPVQSMGWPDV